MELLYLWVEDFRAFTRRDFNLSSRLNFESGYSIKANGKETLNNSVSKTKLFKPTSSILIKKQVYPETNFEQLFDDWQGKAVQT